MGDELFSSDHHSQFVQEIAGLDLVTRNSPFLRVQTLHEVVVVISRSRNLEKELFVERCQADQVPVVIRPSGGGAVVLSPGVVVANLLAAKCPDRQLPDYYFRRFLTPVISALTSLGLNDIRVRGVSDLCYGNRKLAGSSLRLFGHHALFQLSILVDPDLSLMSRYLRHPSREPEYRRFRQHDDFVVSLRQLGCALGPEQVASELHRVFIGALALASFDREL